MASEVMATSIKTPVVPNSHLPLLIGLNAMENQRTILDLVNGTMWMCGPGDIDMEKAVPPGSQKLTLMKSSSGHLVLPVDQFAALDAKAKSVMPEKEVVLPVARQDK